MQKTLHLMGEQTDILKNSVKAVQASVDALISRERARVSIEIVSMGRDKVPTIAYKVISYGPTPALVERAWVYSIVLPSDELEWQDDAFSLPIEVPKIFKESESQI
jgi:hypothetical protein